MLVEKLVQIASVASTVVLYVLIALSILSIGVIVERWWYFVRRKTNLPAVTDRMLVALRESGPAGAIEMLAQYRSPEARVVRDALAWHEAGPEAFQEMLANGIRVRRKEVEAGLLFLGTLGNNAPFIGLFGTVLGVVTAFRGLGSSQAGAMGNVMTGIAEALVATAIGILVAIPAVVAYNAFQKRGTDMEENAAALGNAVLASMKAKHCAPSGRDGARQTVAAQTPDELLQSMDVATVAEGEA